MRVLMRGRRCTGISGRTPVGALAAAGALVAGCATLGDVKTVRLGDPKQSTLMGQEQLEEVEPVRLRVLEPTTQGGILAHAATCHGRRIDTTVVTRTRDVEWSKSPWTTVGAELLVSIPAMAAGAGLWCLDGNGNVDCRPGNGDSGGQAVGATLAGMGALFALGALFDTIAIGLFDGTGYTIERHEYVVPVDLGIEACRIAPVVGRVGEISQDGTTHHVLTDAHGRFEAELHAGRAYLEVDGEQLFFEVRGALAGRAP
jgi:hypothetical protein